MACPVKLTLPLEYQQDIFNELQTEDELVLVARGLGLLRVVTNLLHFYDAAGNNLILVVGADDRENDWIGESLAEHAVVSGAACARGLRVINTDTTSVIAREKMYENGGIFSVTSRILIVDLLSRLFSPEKLTGMIVLHAERVRATSIEAFIIRIYRQLNKHGFLKAFSDAAESCSAGWAPLSTMMRNLFLSKPSLWPRFHLTVAKSLESRRAAEVVELEVPLTDAMRHVQNAVLECVEVSIRELKNANVGIDMGDWNIDSALHKNFDVTVRLQLEPVWHRVSFRTRRIVNDLAVLRNILSALLTHDSVSFLRLLDTILAAHTPPQTGSTHQNQSPWLFLEAANVIFQTSRQRVYSGAVDDTVDAEAAVLSKAMRPVLEEQPKWAVLASILHEIETDLSQHPTAHDDSSGTILVMCSDTNTCRQLRDYLQTMYVGVHDGAASSQAQGGESQPSASFMMHRMLRNYLNWKRDFSKISATLFEENQKVLNAARDQGTAAGSHTRQPPNKRRRIRGGSAVAASPSRAESVGAVPVVEDDDARVAHLLALIRPTDSDDAAELEPAEHDPLDDMEDYFEFFDLNDLLMIHPYDGDTDERVLEEVKPRYIVMYEPDPAFIRRVEVYRSSHTDRIVRVYFLYYGGSVEEQRYLSAVRREKDAFMKLINERKNMAMTLTAEANLDDPQERFLRTVNSRIAGGGRLAATTEPACVIVDTREFRSSLPSLLHGRNMVVIPCQLTVGDYVLSPDICVERKSVRDLIQSFRSGRLYNQVETMFLYYKTPMLLIEFEHEKSFTLDPFTDVTGRAVTDNTNDLQSRLVLLTLAFPQLKIIWSSSPYQTAEIFEDLKKHVEEPDAVKAVSMGLSEQDNNDDDDNASERTFSQVPQDMLRNVPGVTDKNIHRLMVQNDNLAELSNMTLEDLSKHVGREAARQIFQFFNRNLFDE